MSADRRRDKRRFQLEESTTQNGGARTIFVEHMTPGTTIPPHFHTRFAETFDLRKGSITLYSSDKPVLKVLEASPQELEVGKQVTVAPMRYHRYKVGSENAALRVIMTPGHADFERAMKIMNGLADDGGLEKIGDSVVFQAVIMGLCDAHVIGPGKDVLAGVNKEKKDEVNALREELLAKYDTEEALQGLLAEKPDTLMSILSVL